LSGDKSAWKNCAEKPGKKHPSRQNGTYNGAIEATNKKQATVRPAAVSLCRIASPDTHRHTPVLHSLQGHLPGQKLLGQRKKGNRKKQRKQEAGEKKNITKTQVPRFSSPAPFL